MAKKRRRKTKQSRMRWLPALLVLGLAVLAVVSWYLIRGRVPLGELPAEPVAVKVEERLLQLADQLGAGQEQRRIDDPINKVDGIFVRSWYLSLPSQEAVAALVESLESEAAGWGGEIAITEPLENDTIRLRLDVGIEAFDLHLRAPARIVTAPAVVPTVTPRPTVRPSPAPNARGKLAILLDDGGQSLDQVPRVAELPPAVAVSILPFLPTSSATSARLHAAGHEIWLHLPMEPAEYPDRDPGPGAVLVSMAESDIRAAVRSALNSVPHVIGVNNHMGSKATADLRTMTWVMQEIAGRGLLFLDSRTAVNTVAEEVARTQGIRTGRRHIFLDNNRDADAIRRQLGEAIYRARIEGEIVAIGHLTRVTVTVLHQDLPGIAARGADLVPPSELMR